MSKVNVYRTVNGDTWDSVSYKVYGDEAMFHTLMRFNVDLIHIAIFDSDVPIIIPDISMASDFENNSKIPPWRR